MVLNHEPLSIQPRGQSHYYYRMKMVSCSIAAMGSDEICVSNLEYNIHVWYP